MKKLKIYYHDGSIQICTPKQIPGSDGNFNQDWKRLAETIAGHHYHSEHAYLKFDII